MPVIIPVHIIIGMGNHGTEFYNNEIHEYGSLFPYGFATRGEDNYFTAIF